MNLIWGIFWNVSILWKSSSWPFIWITYFLINVQKLLLYSRSLISSFSQKVFSKLKSFILFSTHVFYHSCTPSRSFSNSIILYPFWTCSVSHNDISDLAPLLSQKEISYSSLCLFDLWWEANLFFKYLSTLTPTSHILSFPYRLHYCWVRAQHWMGYASRSTLCYNISIR